VSHLTWHFITPPSLGWLFGNMMLPRFVSMWQVMLGRDMIADECWWLLNNGFGTCIRLVLHHYSISTLLLPYRPHYVNGPDRTRAGDNFYSNDVQPSPVTAAHELVASVARHSATEPCLRHSSAVVGWTPPRFLVSSSRSRSNSDVCLLRPGRARAIDVRRFSPRCTTTRQSVDLSDIFTEQFSRSKSIRYSEST